MSKVIASAVGYDNVQLRQPGDVFECPKNGKGEEILEAKWYKPYKGKKKTAEEESSSEDGETKLT